MMWIRMITTAAGPRLPHALITEHVYQVEDELGQELIDVRAAKKVAGPSPKAQEHATEMAAVDDGEKALAPDGDKKPDSLMDRLTKGSAETEANASTDTNGDDDAHGDEEEQASAATDAPAKKKNSAKAAKSKS